MQATIKGDSSAIWQSILWGRETLRLGTHWQVGDGTNISIFSDHWIPRSFRPITIVPEAVTSLKVSGVIQRSNFWDWEKLRMHLWEVDVQAIMEIPLSYNYR
ncbi:hypothetical protein PanWU01x14_366650 [Parasponia andersonii]|uniref:Uncharacterized protein n=1 Tax=Parasponia andersonii TaxID=3476 RepID=A0A2P5A5J5_PARAD|nr:hypothetical protein PanWU01x14_366650 [Parasponia andersonii]